MDVLGGLEQFDMLAALYYRFLQLEICAATCPAQQCLHDTSMDIQICSEVYARGEFFLRASKHVSNIRGMLTTLVTNRMRRLTSSQDAIACLNTLQSNFAVVDAVRRSGGGMNKQAIPEMIDWCQKTGYMV